MKSIKQEKSKKFAVRIVNLCKFLNGKKEFVMSNQILRSGISIGANLAEAEFAQSKDDFIHKITIALKEASETNYWLELLYQTDHLDKEQFSSLEADCSEIISILVAALNSLKN